MLYMFVAWLCVSVLSVSTMTKSPDDTFLRNYPRCSATHDCNINAMQIVVTLCCLGNNEKKNVYMFDIDTTIVGLTT